MMQSRQIRIAVVGTILLVGFILLSLSVGINSADETIVLQTLSGQLKVISEPGPYLKAFGDTTTYKKVVAVNFTGEKGVEASSKIPGIDVRFLDTSLGVATGVARFRMPVAETAMVTLHREFGSQSAVISNLLERVVTEAAKASARTMSVEDHYSGGAGQMSLDFTDQIRNGIYVVEQITEFASNEDISLDVDDGEVVGSASPVITDPGSTETLDRKQRVFIVRKKNPDGSYMRTENSLEEYSITAISASIEEVDYEKRVDERLNAQKKSAAEEALARQNLKRAEQEAKTAKALGEKSIAEAKAKADEEKLKAEIEAEQAASVARINAARDVAVAEQAARQQEQVLAKQRKVAEGLKVLAKARQEAADNAIDPQYVFDKKLEAWRAVELAKYEHMANARLVPSVIMGGSGSNTDNNTALTMLEVMGINAATQLGLKFDQIGTEQTTP